MRKIIFGLVMFLFATAARAQISGVGQLGCTNTPISVTAITSATATGAVFTSPYLSCTSIEIVLDQTTTITGGALTFQEDVGDGNFVSLDSWRLVDPTTSPFATIGNPYTFVASTNKQFLVMAYGLARVRLNLTSALTGTGSVTPFVVPTYYMLPLAFQAANSSLNVSATFPSAQPVSGTVTANAGTGTFNIQANASVNLNQLAGSALGAPANYGTSPGAVAVLGVNAFVTNTVGVSGTVTTTPPANASTNITQWAGNTLGATSNYGTSPGAVAVPGVNAFVTNTVAENLAQVNGSTVSTAATGVQKVGITGNTGAAMDAAGQNAASPANELLVAGQFNTTPTTIASGNMSPLQLDASGNLLVNVKAGGGSGGTSSTFGAAFPSTGTAIGVKNGSNMVNLAADGSSNLLVNCAVGCSGSSFTDASAFTIGTSVITNVGGTYNDTVAALSAGSAAAARITQFRALQVNLRDSLGNEEGTVTNPLQVFQSAPLVLASPVQIGGTFNRPITSTGDALDINIKYSTGGTLSVNCTSGCSGGTQYTDGTTQATPTGTIALGKNPSNVVHALALDASGNLNVNLNANSFGTLTVAGTVTANQGTANATPWNENLTQVAGTALGSTAVTNFGTAPAAAAVPGVNASLFSGTTGVTNTAGALDINIKTSAAAENCQFNVNLPTPANGANVPFQCDQFGRLIIAPQTVTSTGAQALVTSSGRAIVAGTFGRPVTSTGDALDVNVKYPEPLNQPSAVAANALTPVRFAALTTAQTVKNGPGNLWAWFPYNPNSSACFLDFFNTTAPTLGTTVPTFTISLPATSAANVAPGQFAFANFSQAWSVAAVTATGGATTCTTGVVVQLSIF